jgi:hypothetical protein
MNTLFGVWLLAFGIGMLVRPSFFYRGDNLTPEKIDRNKRILKRGGLAVVVCGAALLAIELLRK